MKHIKFSIENNIASLELNKPKKLNAMDGDLLNELNHCITRLQNDQQTKALFIKGNADVFSAGGDLNFMANMNQTEAREASQWIQTIFEKIENLPFFTIAIIEGIAFGGGLELALACDVRIASDKAQFALPEMKYGIIPGGGGTRRFQEQSNYAYCTYAMSSNKIISANEAFNQGLIQDVINNNEINDFNNRYADKIRTYSLNAILKTKALLKSALNKPRENAFNDEAELFGNFIENESKEKIQSFFESRKTDKK